MIYFLASNLGTCKFAKSPVVSVLSAMATSIVLWLVYGLHGHRDVLDKEDVRKVVQAGARADKGHRGCAGSGEAEDEAARQSQGRGRRRVSLD